MIAVIADDFTGAAELGGIGLRYGLTVELNTSVPKSSNVDLLIISTGTRPASADEAIDEVYNVSKELYKKNAKWIYKKTDSVLRGNIISEMYAFSKASGKNKILFVPANPSLERTIRNCIYYIHKKPLHESDFAETLPAFTNSSNVIDLIGDSPFLKSRVIKADEKIIENYLSIGEASDFDDLKKWADRVDQDIITAGAGDFFEALLQAEGYKSVTTYKSRNIQFGEKTLIVCGSPSSESKKFVDEAKHRGIPVSEMPNELFKNNLILESIVDEWADAVIKAFQFSSRAILAITQPFVRDKQFVKQLRELTALTVRKIMKVVSINELIIEGGDTASSINNKLNFCRFYPTEELARGVLRMKVDEAPNLYLTVKPGSYSWPKNILVV